MAKGSNSKVSKFSKHKSNRVTKSVKTAQITQRKSQTSNIKKLDKEFKRANTHLSINELFKESKDIVEETSTELNYEKLEEELISKFVNLDLENIVEDDSGAQPTVNNILLEDESLKDKKITEILSKDVLSIFNDVSELMKRYKSGKLPKPLRIITMLSIFEKLLN
mmetsp:Transcript_58807/g.49729  ORF Transcript_58807/g.49729 Transcript_58807/m.49729 type:complete len:166 (+) Transcript_58807:11-508(+)